MEVQQPGGPTRVPRLLRTGVLSCWVRFPRSTACWWSARCSSSASCAGAWIAHFTPLEVAVPAGALIGAVAGVLPASRSCTTSPRGRPRPAAPALLTGDRGRRRRC